MRLHRRLRWPPQGAPQAPLARGRRRPGALAPLRGGDLLARPVRPHRGREAPLPPARGARQGARAPPPGRRCGAGAGLWRGARAHQPGGVPPHDAPAPGAPPLRAGGHQLPLWRRRARGPRVAAGARERRGSRGARRGAAAGGRPDGFGDPHPRLRDGQLERANSLLARPHFVRGYGAGRGRPLASHRQRAGPRHYVPAGGRRLRGVRGGWAGRPTLGDQRGGAADVFGFGSRSRGQPPRVLGRPLREGGVRGLRPLAQGVEALLPPPRSLERGSVERRLGTYAGRSAWRGGGRHHGRGQGARPAGERHRAIVGETVELRQRGCDFWGCCPSTTRSRPRST